jgi:hypothetical protein
MKRLPVALLAATLSFALMAAVEAAPAPGQFRSPLLNEVQASPPGQQPSVQQPAKKKQQTAKKPSTSKKKQTAKKSPPKKKPQTTA